MYQISVSRNMRSPKSCHLTCAPAREMSLAGPLGLLAFSSYDLRS
jgi:hypothetical protein